MAVEGWPAFAARESRDVFKPAKAVEGYCVQRRRRPQRGLTRLKIADLDFRILTASHNAVHLEDD